ncbi:MAG: Fic family protein [Planctomycetota bacterium]
MPHRPWQVFIHANLGRFCWSRLLATILYDPFWKSDEKLGVTVTFAAGEDTGEVTGEVRRLIGAIVSEMTRQEMQNVLELKHEDHFRKAYLLPALEASHRSGRPEGAKGDSPGQSEAPPWVHCALVSIPAKSRW